MLSCYPKEEIYTKLNTKNIEKEGRENHLGKTGPQSHPQ